MSIRREHVSSFRSAHLPLRHVLSVKPPLLRCCPASSIGATFNDPNWESEACPICLDPLGEDSSVYPWNGDDATSIPVCSNLHMYHKGCIAQHIRTKGTANAKCPEGREVLNKMALDTLKLKYAFRENADLRQAVKELIRIDPTGQAPHPIHGLIGEWDVSKVEDFGMVFLNFKRFNADISKWVVKNASTTTMMFSGCSDFNVDLYDWEFGDNLTYMRDMFNGCISFNRDLTLWRVRNVRDMSGLFKGCSKFNGNLSMWQTDSVVFASSMFEDTEFFNSDISRWNVNNVVFADKMFKGSLDFNRDLCSWTFRQSAIVTDMFLGAETFNADPSTRPPKVGTNGGGGVSCDS